MTLEEVLPMFKTGSPIRRTSWSTAEQLEYRERVPSSERYSYHSLIGLHWEWTDEDVLADDWELVE